MPRHYFACLIIYLKPARLADCQGIMNLIVACDTCPFYNDIRSGTIY